MQCPVCAYEPIDTSATVKRGVAVDIRPKKCPQCGFEGLSDETLTMGKIDGEYISIKEFRLKYLKDLQNKAMDVIRARFKRQQEGLF